MIIRKFWIPVSKSDLNGTPLFHLHIDVMFYLLLETGFQKRRKGIVGQVCLLYITNISHHIQV